MKQYIPNRMVAGSRYQNFFPTLEKVVQEEIYARTEELLNKEKEYCDKGNYEHMAQILTSIVMYEVLQRQHLKDVCAF